MVKLCETLVQKSHHRTRKLSEDTFTWWLKTYTLVPMAVGIVMQALVALLACAGCLAHKMQLVPFVQGAHHIETYRRPMDRERERESWYNFHVSQFSTP